MSGTVTELLAVGWADAPRMTFDERPGTSATLYIPAGTQSTNDTSACWNTPLRLGDRLELTVNPLPPPRSTGGPYIRHMRIVEHGVQTYWSVDACARLTPSSAH